MKKTRETVFSMLMGTLLFLHSCSKPGDVDLIVKEPEPGSSIPNTPGTNNPADSSAQWQVKYNSEQARVGVIKEALYKYFDDGFALAATLTEEGSTTGEYYSQGLKELSDVHTNLVVVELRSAKKPGETGKLLTKKSCKAVNGELYNIDIANPDGHTTKSKLFVRLTSVTKNGTERGQKISLYFKR